MNPILKDKLDNLPARPGVYLYRDRRGKVLYIGMAKSLRIVSGVRLTVAPSTNCIAM